MFTTIEVVNRIEEEYPTIDRTPSSYNPLHSFDLAKGDQKHYQQQYGDMYFLRLAMLKPAVEEIAADAWGEIEVQFTDFVSTGQPTRC
jgi:DNA polymerase delta subunit 2